MFLAYHGQVLVYLLGLQVNTTQLISSGDVQAIYEHFNHVSWLDGFNCSLGHSFIFYYHYWHSPSINNQVKRLNASNQIPYNCNYTAKNKC